MIDHDNICIFGYNIIIYNVGDKQNIRLRKNINDRRKITKRLMMNIYKYLQEEGFITNPLYK